MIKELKNNYGAGAHFSDCKNYRFVLWRIWNVAQPKLMIVGLNPSTANERTNDPTISKVVRIARRWGYGGIFMTNLFPFVSPNPDDLKGRTTDRIDENDEWLRYTRTLCQDVMFAWGNFPVHGRDEVVKKMFPVAICVAINKNGSPKHPLYVPDDTAQVNYQNNI